MSQHEVVLLLGSNLGNKIKNIGNAIHYISTDIGHIIRTTKIAETDPLEYESSNIYCNIAILLSTNLTPFKLLLMAKKIEVELGRKQDSKELGAYEDRVIDIDVVYYDRLTFESLKLNIPHLKHINHREFSKKLLMELDNERT